MKLVIIALFVLATFSMAKAEDQVFDGYAWEESPYELKVLIVAGYVWGYKSGTIVGILEGINNALKTTRDIGEQVAEQQMAKNFSTCSKIIKNNSEILIKISLAKTHTFENAGEPKYYANEIDSFLKTYPLCRRKEVLSGILPQLAMVWFPSGEKTLTYKDIGEECSER